MDVPHQVTHQLNSCIALNLGKCSNLAFLKNLIKRLPKWSLKIKELSNQEDLSSTLNTTKIFNSGCYKDMKILAKSIQKT